jgi:hypothetical protein
MVQAMELVAPLPSKTCPLPDIFPTILGAFSALPFLWRAYWLALPSLVISWMGLLPIPIPQVWGLVVHACFMSLSAFLVLVLVIEHYHWEKFFILRYTNQHFSHCCNVVNHA